MYDNDIEKCRAISTRFKSLIDEGQPYSEDYLKAKAIHVKITTHFESDPQLKELASAIKIKDKEWKASLEKDEKSIKSF